jgi:multisubunit Na+/H+ antiporter MnhG subunit
MLLGNLGMAVLFCAAFVVFAGLTFKGGLKGLNLFLVVIGCIAILVVMLTPTPVLMHFLARAGACVQEGASLDHLNSSFVGCWLRSGTP